MRARSLRLGGLAGLAGPALFAMLWTVACSPAKPAENAPAAAVDPAVAAKQAEAEAGARRLSDAKAAFDAAAGDAEKLRTLEENLNPWALHRRAADRLAAEDPGLRQLAFRDMEDAAAAGVPDALLWVGQRYADGSDGYPWKPNSGIIMVQRAAEAGHPQAMHVLGSLFETSGPMHDLAKARGWYTRAKDAGWIDAEAALAKMDASAATVR